MKITDDQISKALDEAYLNCGDNAYFGNGFRLGVKFALKQVKNNVDLTGVGGNVFSNEELQTIKTDVLHIYDKVSLSETEVHKRNLILNKLLKQCSGAI